MRALLAHGTGRYSDPWHPLPKTSAALRSLLHAVGFSVRVTSDLDSAFTQLQDVDLLVVNATDPWRNGVTGRGAPEASLAGLATKVASGVGILAVHNSIASLRDYPMWRSLVGGDWVAGTSSHPPFGALTVRLGPSLAATTDQFALEDEGYVDLEVDDDVEILAHHEFAGQVHPLVWRRESERTRVVYDALGHDARSYDSVEHVALLQSAALWAVSRRGRNV